MKLPDVSKSTQNSNSTSAQQVDQVDVNVVLEEIQKELDTADPTTHQDKLLKLKSQLDGMIPELKSTAAKSPELQDAETLVERIAEMLSQTTV